MAKQDFFDNVRNATRGFPEWAELASGSKLHFDSRTERLNSAFLWLTPSTVGGFDPADFNHTPPDQLAELSSAVSRFLAIASEDRAYAHPTREQRQEALREFLHVAEMVANLVRQEWGTELRHLADQVKEWSAEHGWPVREDSKKLSDKFLGSYLAPRLLIHTVDGRLLLDPVARFVAGASGLVDFAAMPSFDSAMIVRDEKGWFVHPDRRWEVSEPWTADSFASTAHQLLHAHETA